MKLFRLLLIGSLFGSTLPCVAGTFTQTKGPAVLEVSYDTDTRRLALADLITVRLTVEGSSSLRAPLAPLQLPASAPWLLVERSALVREIVSGSRLRYQLTYRFAPREPGKKVPFHFPDVKCKDGDADDITLGWSPVIFEVETHIATP